MVDSGTWGSLAVKASSIFREAEKNQRGGDWAGYGESLQQLSYLLGQLESLAGDKSVEEPAIDEEPATDEETAAPTEPE